MSTSIHDLASAAAVAAGLYPVTRTTSGSGPTIHRGGDGPCFAVQLTGVLAAGTVFDGWIEQSANGTTWAAISGGEFEEVSAANDVQVIRFDRSARYVRWTCEIDGTSPSAAIAVL